MDYFYDPMGNRIAKEVDSTPVNPGGEEFTRYVLDGQHVILETDKNGTTLRRKLYGPGVDQLLAVEELNPDGSSHRVLWPVTDRLGSVRYVVGLRTAEERVGMPASEADKPTILKEFMYNAFGLPTQINRLDLARRQTSGSNDIPRLGEGIAFTDLFTAREWDAEAGLYYYRARYYDPFSQRFISEDPMGFAAGDMNLYRYVGNNPTNLVDPTGKFWSWPAAGIGAGIGAVGSGLIYSVIAPFTDEGWTYSGFSGAIVGGALSGAFVGGVVGAGTGDVTFMAAVGMGFWGGVFYGLGESPTRQLIGKGSINPGELLVDVANSGVSGAILGGGFHLVGRPLLGASAKLIHKHLRSSRLGRMVQNWNDTVLSPNKVLYSYPQNKLGHEKYFNVGPKSGRLYFSEIGPGEWMMRGQTLSSRVWRPMTRLLRTGYRSFPTSARFSHFQTTVRDIRASRILPTDPLSAFKWIGGQWASRPYHHSAKVWQSSPYSMFTKYGAGKAFKQYGHQVSVHYQPRPWAAGWWEANLGPLGWNTLTYLGLSALGAVAAPNYEKNYIFHDPAVYMPWTSALDELPFLPDYLPFFD